MRSLPLILALWASTAAAAETLMDDTLKITVAQSGFAGVTGHIYEVDALANFTISAFVNDQVTEQMSDVLPPEALATLQTLLDQPLGSDTATAPEVNPMTITVNYQGQEWVVSSPADESVQSTQGQSVRNLAAWIAMQAKTQD